MSKTAPRRSKIPYDVQARVWFRDKWLCWLCGRPVIFAPALKYLRLFVEKSSDYPQPTAYWSAAYRRDESPLLDEMAAVIDHCKAHVKGGGIDESNLAAACNRCNMRKSDEDKDTYTTRHPKRRIKSKYGEPEHWDGFVSLFMILAREDQARMTPTERAWHQSFEKLFAEEAARSIGPSNTPLNPTSERLGGSAANL